MRPLNSSCNRSFGIIGGLGTLAGADVFLKLVKSIPARADAEYPSLTFEQHPFIQRASNRPEEALTERKIYIFDMIRNFKERDVEAVILPCFLSHAFIDELQSESLLPIVNMMESLRQHVRRRYPAARKIGVLTSSYARRRQLFEKAFSDLECFVVHPRLDFDDAIYGPTGIKAGVLQGPPIDLLRRACDDLIAQGADLIIPGMTEIPIVAESIGPLAADMVDSNLVYAQFAVSGDYRSLNKPFKVGVVGGVGPAATVDFVKKIVGSTPAARDQDHIKLVVEQNPQIPDRTENLLGQGADPTVSLYATCKKLEASGADLVAIPCNTAHAFVERIQPYLGIPILNMLTETAAELRRRFPKLTRVGLLATSGTLGSGVYAKALAAENIQAVVPDESHQALVMRAIYGPEGVKAGCVSGPCHQDILAAANHLAARGMEAIILGCTELPLLLNTPCFTTDAGSQVALIDPTLVLAQRCVLLAGRST
jgi:aspartate racemase